MSPHKLKRVLKNLGAIFGCGRQWPGSRNQNDRFLTTMDDYATVNAVYGRYFTINPPARSAVAVTALPLGALVEIEAVALMPDGG